ncbi:beta-xylosidase [Klebsiella grimontii]|uniref:Beta-xylosidase n=1 Tax=Klebsiella grimontii TaxID=2058152 RepID=A0A7H4NWA0_9ENTR|nr:beta-xylosidase [Klebsiella grimontii]
MAKNTNTSARSTTPHVFSDEYSRYGEFTGAFVGMACVDSMLHRKEALFDFFSYRAVEDAIIE